MTTIASTGSAPMWRCPGASSLRQQNVVNGYGWSGCRLQAISVELFDGKESNQIAYFDSFEDIYRKLAEEKPVSCSATEQDMPAVPAPSVVVIDVRRRPDVLHAVRRLSETPVKAIVFYSAASYFPCIHFAPIEYGCVPDHKPRVLEEVRSGRPLAQVAFEHVPNFGDSVVCIPGLPPMYHYELDPSDVNAIIEPIIGVMWMSATTVMQEYCDAVIITSPEVYEPQGTAQMRRWMHGTNRDVWCLGPLLHLQRKHRDVAAENKLSEDAHEIQVFMDRILDERDKKSLLYISFGPIFWPLATENLWAFLDVVMEKNIPLILSHASPFAVIPEEVLDKMKTYADGLLTKWSPQQTVLARWLLTHGGQNSVIEAMVQGVPLICWPFHADQPCNSLHLSENLDAAYELIQVRTGKGLLPLHRTGKAPAGTVDAINKEARRILQMAWGEDGNRKRGDMKRSQDQVLCA